jgi:hypothetical protein
VVRTIPDAQGVSGAGNGQMEATLGFREARHSVAPQGFFGFGSVFISRVGILWRQWWGFS